MVSSSGVLRDEPPLWYPEIEFLEILKQISLEAVIILRRHYYRNHRLVKSVDFGKNGETPHVHYWSSSGLVGRKRHDKRNIFALSERDKRLMNLAKKFHLKK